MKKLLVLGLLSIQYLFAAEPLETYFSYLKELSHPNGQHKQNEIQIAVDVDEILKIQQIQEARLIKKGYSIDEAKEYSRIGIVAEDHYWIWLRDAVYFPNKVTGTYDRLLWKSELKDKHSGVAILPILPTGEIALLLNYRHATRSWELEITRGRIEPNESLESAAFRELKEETGLIAAHVHYLGEMAIDTGVLASIIPVFICHVSSQSQSTPEYSEAIGGIISLTKEEVRRALKDGFVEVTIDHQKNRVPLRDPFLTFALLQAEIRELL